MGPTRTAKLLIGAAAALSLAGCQKPGSGGAASADPGAAKQAVDGIEAGWNQAFHARNLDQIVAPYAKDAVFVLPGLPAQVGTDAIRKTYTEALKDPNFDVTLAADKMEVANSGELALTQGHFTMRGTDPKTKQAGTMATGSYVTVYKKQADGSWKAIQDWAAANPPAAGTPSK